MISAKSYDIFFTKLREGALAGFQADLDVVMTAARTGNGGG
jgi:hypothetical protein